MQISGRLRISFPSGDFFLCFVSGVCFFSLIEQVMAMQSHSCLTIEYGIRAGTYGELCSCFGIYVHTDCKIISEMGEVTVRLL